MTLSAAWTRQRHAADYLGISERTLHRWRAAGLLQPGQHFRRKFPNPNSPLLYHLERCEEAMNKACARLASSLEVAPSESSQSSSRPIEMALHPTPQPESGVRPRPATSRHRSPQGQTREDRQPLAHSSIDTVMGPLAKHPHGIHRGRSSSLRRG